MILPELALIFRPLDIEITGHFPALRHPKTSVYATRILRTLLLTHVHWVSVLMGDNFSLVSDVFWVHRRKARLLKSESFSYTRRMLATDPALLAKNKSSLVRVPNVQ